MLRGITQQNFVWTPTYLFANGQNGHLYDPSDLATLFQDAAGTIPVAADGDPVGLMLDKSGNGNHASQSTTAAKPAYRTDGTLHWLEGDGVDDFIGTGIVPYDGNQVFLSTAFQQVSGGSRFGGLYRFLREGGSPTGTSDNFLEEYHDNPSEFFRKTLVQRYPSVIPLLVKAKYPTDFSSFISWFKNNQDGWAEQVIGQGSGIETKPTLSLGAGNATLEIFRGYAGEMIKGNFFGQIWVSGAISDEAISKANRYLAEKSGVTLP